MKNIYKALLATVLSIDVNLVAAQINIYSPNATNGPTDALIKKIIIPKIELIVGSVAYENKPGAEQAYSERHADMGDVLILTDSNYMRISGALLDKFEKTYEPFGIFSVRPAIFFSSGKSAVTLLDFTSKRSIKVGYSGMGSTSERCATQIKNSYGSQITTIAYDSTAKLIQALLSAEIDGVCDSNVGNLEPFVLSHRISPIAISHQTSISPYSMLKQFPQGQANIDVRGFVGFFGRKDDEKTKNHIKTFLTSIKKDSQAIDDLAKMKYETPK